MKIRGRFMIALFMIGILSGVVMTSANAETFNIGEKVSKPDLSSIWYNYTSGSFLELGDCSDDQMYENITAIFDGNTSTGINGSYFSSTWKITLYFPHPLYVNNITVLPNFGGGTTNYSISLFFGANIGRLFSGYNDTPHFSQLNLSLDSIEIRFKVPDSKLYFNDIIINYTPSLTNLIEIQNQFDTLNSEITKLNNLINELNLTQNELTENVTELWSFYNQFNGSLTNLLNEIANLNITTNENITLIKNDLTIIGADIYNLYQSLENLTTNVTELSEIQYQIDITTQHINNLSQNITEIKNSMPSEYDDTSLVNQVFLLESENIKLRNEINNLSSEIGNLTLENTNLNNEIIQLEYENAVFNNELINMSTEIEKLKDDKDESDNYVTFGAFIMGILGLLIAIIAIIFVTRKSGKQNLQIGKKENKENDSLKNVVNGEDSDT
ncbi:MAG: hypothetical protein JSW00_12940 [Thermoplasmata archaeon]|nr:MAG: hypothetical protein JSW00_12940 [Thermoplasmata archaeon]